MTEPSAPPSRSIGITVACWIAIFGSVAFLMFARIHKAHAGPVAPAAAVTDAHPGFEMLLTGRAAVWAAQNASTSNGLRVQLRATLNRLALRPIDQLAEAVIVRELSGPAAALKVLPTDPVSPDASALTALYSADSPTVLTDSQRADLARDLGYFGRLAATQGGPADAPERQAVLADARHTSVAVTVAGALVLVMFLLGLCGLVTLILLFATGVLRFGYVPTAVATPRVGTVWLEVFALWLVAFIGFSLAMSLLPIHLPMVANELLVAGLSALIAFGWPAWRSALSSAEVRATLGLHSGRGVLTEIACGAAGYIAGLPVLGIGLLLTLGLTKLAGTHPTHPIEQEFGDGMSGGHVIALFATAALLAPILEETLFRGALYAHLRRRHWAWLSAGIVAFVFAAIHPQGWTTIPVLGSIALILAFLREWRGSLIAPMTAHAINNGVLVAVIVIALR